MTDTVKVLPPEEQICFALYSASRSLTALYRDLLAPLGVTYPQYLVLLTLWDAGTLSVGTLGKRLQLDSGTLSPLLRRLEQAGLVSKGRSATDERVVEISLTPAGDALRSEAPRISDAVCGSTGLAIEDLIQLQAQVSALAERVRSVA
ncbi:DNA-binding MarR family transcriptional regulator [Conyzicola lurida]|uniref:DNA-binding MarR family transcriptional regulator n=1 Tax=Conyzicola lurida TaxID=1172621 RepID=A0A841AT23_9MICO|nr:MarR family transcriptional regulator [Conyzicola lurida]MBB5844549.1 DNA-binding MarR family transcriptional regulator [Conyzicola lurida]